MDQAANLNRLTQKDYDTLLNDDYTKEKNEIIALEARLKQLKNQQPSVKPKLPYGNVTEYLKEQVQLAKQKENDFEKTKDPKDFPSYLQSQKFRSKSSYTVVKILSINNNIYSVILTKNFDKTPLTRIILCGSLFNPNDFNTLVGKIASSSDKVKNAKMNAGNNYEQYLTGPIIHDVDDKNHLLIIEDPFMYKPNLKSVIKNKPYNSDRALYIFHTLVKTLYALHFAGPKQYYSFSINIETIFLLTLDHNNNDISLGEEIYRLNRIKDIERYTPGTKIKIQYKKNSILHPLYTEGTEILVTNQLFEIDLYACAQTISI